MNYYLDVLKKYATFSGRASRMEYWMFALLNAVVVIILALIDSLVLNARSEGAVTGIGVLSIIYWLATLLPIIALAVRRLHDTNRSGWWLLIGLVPIIGGIWLFVLTVLDSTPGQNQYGPSPKKM